MFVRGVIENVSLSLCKCILVTTTTMFSISNNKKALVLKDVLVIMCIFLSGLKGAQCLRGVRLVAPDAVERGSSVHMRCEYDLETDSLYSVKWYRGDREFCRYSPRDVPPIKVFRIPGIEVDVAKTDAESLTFLAAKQVADGKYTCEVSADSPSFQTAQVHTTINVVDLPESGPTIYGMKRRYRAGMKFKAECVSRSSYPAANLSFFINNKPANAQHVWRRIEVLENQLVNSYSTIQFVIQKNLFIDRRLKVRCTANIFSLYLQSLEKSSEEERVQTTPQSPPDLDEIVVYPIHRLREPAGGVLRLHPNLSSIALTVISVFAWTFTATVLR